MTEMPFHHKHLCNRNSLTVTLGCCLPSLGHSSESCSPPSPSQPPWAASTGVGSRPVLRQLCCTSCCKGPTADALPMLAQLQCYCLPTWEHRCKHTGKIQFFRSSHKPGLHCPLLPLSSASLTGELSQEEPLVQTVMPADGYLIEPQLASHREDQAEWATISLL